MGHFKLAIRKRGNKLEAWEVALIKAMIDDGRWTNDQDILAYFTRPTRSVNHRAIGEIRSKSKHSIVEVASADDLSDFLETWPDTDPDTGLPLRGDELLIKAREAMIAAVHTFNSAGLTFRAEIFIVTAVIAWTYLLHAWYKREGVDYRHTKMENGAKVVTLTAEGAEKFWELAQCLKHPKCPVETSAKDNLNFLLALRHEIEHRSTDRIDDAISAKLQACCINFNDAIKEWFGPNFTLERRLPIALQFVTFGPDQLNLLKRARNLPSHIEGVMESFEANLTAEQRADPRYGFRVYMVGKTANRPASSDLAVEIVPAGSELANTINIAIKEVEKKKFLPGEVVKAMHSEGWARFSMDKHTKLWKRLDAKKAGQPYGAVAVGNTWCWYQPWIDRVREECQQNPSIYK